MTTTNLDLTLDVCAEDGSRAHFYQNDEESVCKILRQLASSRLFTQPLFVLASEHSVSAIPCRTIDLMLAHTESVPPVSLPPGWLDAVEIDFENFPLRIAPEDVSEAKDRELFLTEIHTVGDWMICLKLETKIPATLQERRQSLSRLFELPVIPFRLMGSGIGFINPAKIIRVTVYPPIDGVAETALPADLLQSIRA